MAASKGACLLSSQPSSCFGHPTHLRIQLLSSHPRSGEALGPRMRPNRSLSLSLSLSPLRVFSSSWSARSGIPLCYRIHGFSPGHLGWLGELSSRLLILDASIVHILFVVVVIDNMHTVILAATCYRTSSQSLGLPLLLSATFKLFSSILALRPRRMLHRATLTLESRWMPLCSVCSHCRIHMNIGISRHGFLEVPSES
ncbi:hypothetical protein C8Q79DRAFT_760402 [Trametes meyenii]|nr:hypothetical protein C8Q79DRAFT_760402 [Trametes meyenii]